MELRQVLIDGAQSGVFRKLDPVQFAVSMTGINVFYFISAPIHGDMGAGDSFSPERLQLRRASAADMLASTLFVDAEQGRKLAARVAEKWESRFQKKQPRKVIRK